MSMRIPEALQTVFSASPSQDDGDFVIKLPRQEIEAGALDPEDTYRIGIYELPERGQPQDNNDSSSVSPNGGGPSKAGSGSHESLSPPVEEGEMLMVTIESTGDEGDGIAKTDEGYTVIVPDTNPGDKVEVKVTNVKKQYAFAKVVKPATAD
jgi:predicted RNA-binding protein with TRAM domain